MNVKSILKGMACAAAGGVAAYGSLFVAYKVGTNLLKKSEDEAYDALIGKLTNKLVETSKGDTVFDYTTCIEDYIQILNVAREILPRDYTIIATRINAILDMEDPDDMLPTLVVYMQSIKDFCIDTDSEIEQLWVDDECDICDGNCDSCDHEDCIEDESGDKEEVESDETLAEETVEETSTSDDSVQ